MCEQCNVSNHKEDIQERGILMDEYDGDEFWLGRPQFEACCGEMHGLGAVKAGETVLLCDVIKSNELVSGGGGTGSGRPGV